MPAGSEYRGPSEALEAYASAVEAAGFPVKGAKNPYTSHNGHMFSFLDADGSAAVRLSDELGAEFASEHETGPVERYGSVMHGYCSVPADLLEEAAGFARWLQRSHEWIDTLPPK
jgi:hypothetical protein